MWVSRVEERLSQRDGVDESGTRALHLAYPDLVAVCSPARPPRTEPLYLWTLLHLHRLD